MQLPVKLQGLSAKIVFKQKYTKEQEKPDEQKRITKTDISKFTTKDKQQLIIYRFDKLFGIQHLKDKEVLI
jgi:hypothetical protein